MKQAQGELLCIVEPVRLVYPIEDSGPWIEDPSMGTTALPPREQNARLIIKEPVAYNVNQFCAAHDLSRSFFYDLLRSGDGPRIMRVRGRTLISQEAAAEWRAQCEQRG